MPQSPILAADRPTLENITFKALDTNMEQVTFKLNGTYIPKIFAIKGKNPRVVFDFPQTTIARTMPNSIDTNGAYIKKIRIGLHFGDKPKTRVVFDLNGGEKIDFSQNFDRGKNSLTILVFPAESRNSAGMENRKKEKQQTADRGTVQKKEPVLAANEKKNKNKIEPVTGTTPVAHQPVKTSSAPSDTAAAFPRAEKEETGKQQTETTTPPESAATVAVDAGETPAPTEAPPAVEATVRPAVADSKNKTPVLQSVTFDNSSDRGEMIQFKLTAFQPPTVFGIEEGLPRVVCDFKNTLPGDKLKNIIHAKGRYVKTIRIGRHNNPDKIRVVIDLQANNNYDLQQVFFKEENLFVIIVNTMRSSVSQQKTTNKQTTPVQ